MIEDIITDTEQISEFIGFVRKTYPILFNINILDEEQLIKRYDYFSSRDYYDCKGLLGKICDDCNINQSKKKKNRLLGYCFVSPYDGYLVVDMLSCKRYELLVNLSHEFGHVFEDEKCRIICEIKANIKARDILREYFHIFKNKDLEKACFKYLNEIASLNRL